MANNINSQKVDGTLDICMVLKYHLPQITFWWLKKNMKPNNNGFKIP